MKKILLSRRGVSLVEVVVALVVISVISAATMSVLMNAVTQENKSAITLEVKNTAENAIACFRFADGEEGAFIEYLNRTVAEEEFTKQNGSYVFSAEGYTITITMLTEQVGFSFRAVNGNDKELANFTFTNGGAEE